MRDDLAPVDAEKVPPWEDVGDNALADPVLVYRDRRNIQHVMWLYVGLARSTRRLARALRELNHQWEAIDGFYRATRLSDSLIGLRNLAQAAWVVTRAAWHNRGSRGAHFREDAQPDDFASLYDQEALEEPWV
jgi:L-aspartate oxidase